VLSRSQGGESYFKGKVMNNSREDGDPIALVDLDRTLCDHDDGLHNGVEHEWKEGRLMGMNDLASQDEKMFNLWDDDVPSYVKNRMRIVRSQEGWWRNLKKIPQGFEVFDLLVEAGFSICITSKAAWTSENSWTEKFQWCRRNLQSSIVESDRFDMNTTTEKSIVYGKILFDDYVGFVEPWLEQRSRGLVIMPALPHNDGFEHPNVVKYDGTTESYAIVKNAIQTAYARGHKEPLVL